MLRFLQNEIVDKKVSLVVKTHFSVSDHVILGVV